MADLLQDVENDALELQVIVDYSLLIRNNELADENKGRYNFEFSLRYWTGLNDYISYLLQYSN